MGDKMDLSKKEAVKKVQEIVDSASMCLFVTNLTVTSLTDRTIGTQKVDDDGTLWFLSPASSNKNREIADDSRVQLFYSNSSRLEYLSIYGKASVVIDKAKATELWNPVASAWFANGVDDPELTLLKVQPQNADYWDTRHEKMDGLLKIIAGAMAGKIMDDSIEQKVQC